MAIKTDSLHLRISPETKAKLQELAKKENRSIGNYIEVCTEKEYAKLKQEK